MAEAEEHFVTLPTRVWKIGLAGGAAVWLFAAVLTGITQDDILVPTVIILGSFLVPGTMTAFALSRRRAAQLTTEAAVLGFFAAGTLAVVSTAVLETYLLPAAAGTFVGVGIIEEMCKALVVVAVAQRVHARAPRDGMVLGAVVGAGFAAFESAGYALQTMIDNLDHRPIVNIMETEAFRGVLSPFGHITWTALVGGALFASSRGGRFHLTARLAGTAAGVIALHALWDASYGWAIMLARGVLGDGWQLRWPNAQGWQGVPSGEEITWFNVFYDGQLILLAVIGAWWVVHSWRRYGHWAPATPPAG
ncbi:MAG: protease PrsW [Solirubrobacteraceae bacterium]|jgi:RsiW-degrading membrane proteinase PrsW (M82 family)|nr:protease PrsW [Solirubrobacteraceae bacterium]